jgi:hypothetical protein
MIPMAHDIFLGRTKRDWSCGSFPPTGKNNLESSLGKGGGEAAHRAAAGAGRGLGALAKGIGKGLGALAKGAGAMAKGAGSSLTPRKSSEASRSSNRRSSPSRSFHSSNRPAGIPFTHKLSNALIRRSHKNELKRYSRIEEKSAQGNPAHRKYVAHQVALAKKGDKKALASAQAMKLARMVRLSSRTPADRRCLSLGNKLAKGVLRKNPKAIKQYRQLQAAAGQGNPDAKKVLAGAGLSAAVLATVATGRIVLPKSNTSKQKTTPPTKPPAKQEREPAPAQETAQASSPGPVMEESSPGEGTASSPDEIQELYTKLWTEHAHQLAQQDLTSHLKPKPLGTYETLSRLWAKRELARRGLPTSRLAGNPSPDPSLERLARSEICHSMSDGDENQAQSEDRPGGLTI